MKYLVVVMLAAAALTGGAAAATIVPGPCDFSMTYFPPGREDANIPDAWTRTNQKKAGNSAADELYRIILASYPVPTLQVWPIHWLFNNETEVPLSCWTPQSSASAQGKRRLQQTTKSYAYVVKPATYKVDFTLRNRNLQATPAMSANGSRTSPPLAIKLDNFGSNVPDGEYCVNVYVTMLAQSAVVMADLNATLIKLPAADMQIKKSFCFVKLEVRPTADVTFSSCNSTFGIKLSGISPLPLYPQDSTAAGLMLSKTVFHVWAKQNATIPGATVQPATAQDYLDEYLTLDTNKTDTMIYSTRGLKEGIYEFKAEGSITSDLEELVSVAGTDYFDKSKLVKKYMGGMLQNGSAWMVYVQNKPSRIFNLGGPTGTLNVGDQATFTWESQGYGDFFCYVDGKRVFNMADKLHCESPLTLILKDIGNHTLDVTLADVCKNTVKRSIEFGSWGWALNMTGISVEDISSATTDTAQEPFLYRQTNYTTVKKNAAPALFASSGLYSLLMAVMTVMFVFL